MSSGCLKQVTCAVRPFRRAATSDSGTAEYRTDAMPPTGDRSVSVGRARQRAAVVVVYSVSISRIAQLLIQGK